MSDGIIRIIIVAYFVAFASAFAFWTPIGAGFDESNHLAYVSYVARTGRMPNQYVPSESIHFEGHQPPLYYFLAASLLRRMTGLDPAPRHELRAPAYTADPHAAYALRGLSVFLATLNLILVFRIADHFALAGWWRFFPALFVATLPQFAYVAGSVNNDNLANLACTAAIASLLEIADQPSRSRWYLLFGCWLGLGLLTKKTALFLVPGAALEAAYLLWKANGGRGKILLQFGMAALAAALLSGWLFVRNHRLYGDWLGAEMEERTLRYIVDKKPLWSSYFIGRFAAVPTVPRFALLAMEALPALWPFIVGLIVMQLAGIAGVVRTIRCRRRLGLGTAAILAVPGVALGVLFLWMGWSWYVSGEFVERLYVSAIGFFASWDAGLPTGVYLAYGTLLVAAAIGLGVNGRSWRRDADVGLAIAWISLCFVGILYYNLTYSQAQGRFLFPVLPLVATLVAIGLQSLLDRFGRQRFVLPALGLLVCLFVMSDILGLDVVRSHHQQTKRGKPPYNHVSWSRI
jgi:4-amino-4-deoxy-L-arabinose transferase-like glycosyltransferase